MTRNNEELVNQLNKTQYKEFIRYALGLKYFLQDKNYEIRANLDDDLEEDKKKDEPFKEIKNKTSFAFLYKENKKVKSFEIRKFDYEDKTFHDEYEKYYVDECFNEINASLINQILQGIIGISNISDEQKYNDVDYELGHILYKNYEPQRYRLILGSGVNAGYGLGSWQQLLQAIEGQIQSIKNINLNTLQDIEASICNTNYIAPQILKDLNHTVYYQEIYSNLYSSFNPYDTDISYKPSIVDTTLYQVARILSNNPDSIVLTFNYDDVLERVLDNNFTSNYCTKYAHSKKKQPGIEIIHSHGYYPYGSPNISNAHSIVLSCYEYMNGYRSSGSYARKKLNDFINGGTCILIGNSLSDYEEQKVFFQHHKKYPSRFNYIFSKKSDPSVSWVDNYKSIYFLKMGVIPVFFDTFPDMVNFLKTI